MPTHKIGCGGGGDGEEELIKVHDQLNDLFVA
jgi:hypothetical protein